MSIKAKLLDGPYAGQTVNLAADFKCFELGISDQGEPDQSKPPQAMTFYRRKGIEDGIATYVTIGFQRVDNKLFEIEFINGPLNRKIESPTPILHMDAIQTIPVNREHSILSGVEDPVGGAVYERKMNNGTWKFVFVKIDNAPEIVERMVREVNDQRAICAVNQFYETPNYGIYSKKPTDEHTQVSINVKHRKAKIDQGISELIKCLWEMDFDTIGSCQGPIKAGKNAGKSYIGFPRRHQGVAFAEMLSLSGIDCKCEDSNLTITGNHPGSSEPVKKKLPSARVVFAPEDICRIVKLLQTKMAELNTKGGE